MNLPFFLMNADNCHHMCFSSLYNIFSHKNTIFGGEKCIICITWSWFIKLLNSLELPVADRQKARRNIKLDNAATCWTFKLSVLAEMPVLPVDFHSHHVGLDTLSVLGAPSINVLPSLV